MCRNTNLSVSPFFHDSSSCCFINSICTNFSEDGVRVENFTPFMYIDLSDLSNLAVYVQSLPSTYNVTEYKVWLINNGTKSVSTAIISTNKNSGLIRYNFSAPDGVYYVKVAALHPKCGKHGCANSTSPYICISKDNLAKQFFILQL